VRRHDDATWNATSSNSPAINVQLPNAIMTTKTFDTANPFKAGAFASLDH
jgi:hypothetical protein